MPGTSESEAQVRKNARRKWEPCRHGGGGGWLVGWLAGWVGGWLVGWLAGWVGGWLVGWLVVGCWLLVVGCWLLVVGCGCGCGSGCGCCCGRCGCCRCRRRYCFASWSRSWRHGDRLQWPWRQLNFSSCCPSFENKFCSWCKPLSWCVQQPVQARKKGQLKKISQQADNEIWQGRRGRCRFFLFVVIASWCCCCGGGDGSLDCGSCCGSCRHRYRRRRYYCWCCFRCGGDCGW